MRARRLVRHATRSALALTALLVLNSPAGAADLADLVEQVEPTVVRIETDRSIGSGVVVDADKGWVVTNYHVIDGAKKAKVKFKSEAEISVDGFVVFERRWDLALLAISTAHEKLPAIKIADQLPRKGEKVATFGAPQGLSFSASEGVVASVRKGSEISELLSKELYAMLDYDLNARWVQSTAAISHGNSGGPLVNFQGELLGLNTWSYPEGQNLNFAISNLDIKNLLERAGKAPDKVKSLARLPRRAEPAASKAPEEFKLVFPSGKTFRFELFTVDLSQFQSAFNGKLEMAVLRHPNGNISAVAQHKGGMLHGPAVAQYEDGGLMTYATYLDGKRHGLLKTWKKDGHREILAQFVKGKRHGFWCLFYEGIYWMIIEYEYDKPKTIQMMAGLSPTASYSSRAEADADPKAAATLKMLDKLETDTRVNEAAFKRQITQQEEKRRRALAAQMGPEKRRVGAERAARLDAEYYSQVRAFIRGTKGL